MLYLTPSLGRFKRLSPTNPKRPLSELVPESLYVILFERLLPKTNLHHWGLYHHQDAERGGSKYHVDDATGRWITQHGTTMEATNSDFLIGLIRIADFDPAERLRIKECIQADDKVLDSIYGMDCRVWVTRALGRLKSEGIINFESLEILDREILEFANINEFRFIYGVQPRALGYSKVCGLTH
ncbi:hypothetical protein MMC29_001841 [Sticta canariensis]|nr:hypothetical protein [Sticta canariensis]